jgi:hypothetical protein
MLSASILRARSRVLDPMETFEDARQLFGRDADAGIGDRQLDSGARRTK